MPFLCAFLPVVYLLHCLIPSVKVKNFFLIIVSLLFYAYGESVYVILMIVCAFLNYVMAGLIGMSGGTVRRLLLALTVIADLGMLSVYKYAGMIIATVDQVAGMKIPVPVFHLPVGISFFTFQAISYVADVYRKRAGTEKSFWKVLLYISFFPQLIAGPIIKYHDISARLDDRKVTLKDSCQGMRRFIIGLSKKVLISNTMGVAADYVFALRSGELGMLTAWIGAAAYTLQIYFDFSGYSDMAIGIGRMFGFRFAENFRYPYAAASIQDFWRRWHISLTDWFREYLYIPLGGNRKGRTRTWLNRLIVFFFTGLWHGADWTFVFWGLYHGVLSMFETLFPQKTEKGRWLRHIYVMAAVCIGFVLFRAESLGQAWVMYRAMFTGYGRNISAVAAAAAVCDRLFLFTLAAAVLCALPVKEWLEKAMGGKEDRQCGALVLSGFSYGAAFLLLPLCIMSLAGGTYNPFIYFRF